MISAVPSNKVFEDELRGVIESSQVFPGVRVCMLLTRDREHAIRMLIQVVTACDRPLFHLTLAERRRYNPNQLKWDIIGGTLKVLLCCFGTQRN